MSNKHADFDDYGQLAASSLTGSYQTLLTLTDDADILILFNTSNHDLILRVPSKAARSTSATTKEIYVCAAQPFVLDLRPGSKRLAKGLIEVKHAGVAPTSGSISATALR